MTGGLCRLPVLAHLKEVRLQQGGRAFDMSYEYTFRNTASDFFWFRLENTYRSWMAVINFVFTAAMIALAISRFSETNLLGKVLIVIGILVFPVIQPLAMGIAAPADHPLARLSLRAEKAEDAPCRAGRTARLSSDQPDSGTGQGIPVRVL